MKQAIAILVCTVNIMKIPFAAALSEGNFPVKNFEGELTEDDYGKQVLVEYDPQDQFCTFKAFYAGQDSLERIYQSGKTEETVQLLLTEAVKASDSCLDEAIHTVYSNKASEVNNGGKEAQIRCLVQEHGVHAIKIIRELLNLKTCPKCGANLTLPKSVSRLYISKDEEYEDSYIQGHFEGDYIEADTSPSYPLSNHDLIDGSDKCMYCDTVVG